jgi:hypothetical protein
MILSCESTEIAAIRNLGGQAEISLNDVATLDSEFQFKELVVIHHTDCGVTHLTSSGVYEYLKENLPSATTAELGEFPIRIFSKCVPYTPVLVCWPCPSVNAFHYYITITSCGLVWKRV